jgi:hypothetical protein
MTDQMHDDAKPIGVPAARSGHARQSFGEDRRLTSRIAASPPTDVYPQCHRLPVGRDVFQPAPVAAVTCMRPPPTPGHGADACPCASTTNPSSVAATPAASVPLPWARLRAISVTASSEEPTLLTGPAPEMRQSRYHCVHICSRPVFHRGEYLTAWNSSALDSFRSP